MQQPDFVDLVSPERDGQPGHPAKRARLENRASTGMEPPGPSTSGTVIDLSSDAPLSEDDRRLAEKLEADPSASARARMPATPGGRPLWGELEDPTGPPRWRHVRRRSNNRTPCTIPETPCCSEVCVQPQPAPLPPPWPGSRPWDASQAVPRSDPFLAPRQLPPPAPPITRRSAALGIAAAETRDPPVTRAASGAQRNPSTRPSPLADADMRNMQARLNATMQRMRARQPPRPSRSWAAEAEEQDLARQMDRLDPREVWAPSPDTLELPEPANWPNWQDALGSHAAPRSRGMSITEAMLGMLEEGSFTAPSFPGGQGGMPGRSGGIPHLPRARRSAAVAHELRQLSALREAMVGAEAGSRLPLHLLLSDRDFDENDYEALLALDDNVESRQGANDAAINGIPTSVVGPDGGGCGGEARCAICLEEYEPGAVQRHLRCTHRFHCSCIDRWLARKATCPICQQSCCE